MKLTNPLETRGRLRLDPNVEYKLFDKSGKIKKLFQPNSLAQFLLKHGLISPFAKIPFFFGNYRNSLNISNLITNAGMAGVASRINGDGAEAAFTYIAVGTGTTAANAADTTLQTETTTSGLARAAATVSRVTTDVANDTAQMLKSFSVTGTVAVTESGVFNASSAGVMLARQVFTAINVVNGDTLQVTWKVDID